MDTATLATGSHAPLKHGITYNIVNVGHQKLLHLNGAGKVVEVSNPPGKPVETASPATPAHQWQLLQAQGDNLCYIMNIGPAGEQLFLGANGDLSGLSAGPLAQLGSNFHWYFVPCPYPNAYYIINAAQGKFLDTHGSDVTVWNNNGADVQTIIRGNTSIYAGNIRWVFLGCDRVMAPLTDHIRILHLSDTHSNHWGIEQNFPLPEADILLHTGDFCNNGTPQEVAAFNHWLGSLKFRFRHMIVIFGNHDTWSSMDIDTAQSIITNAVVLHHTEINIEGIRIYGLPWMPGQEDGNPDSSPWAGDLFRRIPSDVDILMTHGPPDGIFDKIGKYPNGWGSSKLLKNEIIVKKPKVHLFGHLHEQRGLWQKKGGAFEGGVEFKPWPFPDIPPPADYPCQLISCNAMNNHHSWDKLGNCIAGPARLIHAQKADGKWNFTV